LKQLDGEKNRSSAKNLGFLDTVAFILAALFQMLPFALVVAGVFAVLLIIVKVLN